MYKNTHTTPHTHPSVRKYDLLLPRPFYRMFDGCTLRVPVSRGTHGTPWTYEYTQMYVCMCQYVVQIIPVRLYGRIKMYSCAFYRRRAERAANAKTNVMTGKGMENVGILYGRGVVVGWGGAWDVFRNCAVFG